MPPIPIPAGTTPPVPITVAVQSITRRHAAGVDGSEHEHAAAVLCECCLVDEHWHPSVAGIVEHRAVAASAARSHIGGGSSGLVSGLLIRRGRSYSLVGDHLSLFRRLVWVIN
jgi:hypothetical protein